MKKLEMDVAYILSMWLLVNTACLRLLRQLFVPWIHRIKDKLKRFTS